MNGAELLLKTAAKAGIEVCFTNPGTTEMPLVGAFDGVAGIRPILGLFEGSWHRSADAPLSMDIVKLAETVSGWQRTSLVPQNLSGDTADAITAALQGKVATLIVPSDIQLTSAKFKNLTPMPSERFQIISPFWF
jgi:acetolactate synthase-1/2/3 large subunit